MIYEELIHRYLDNDLDHTGEETLFQHISTNDDLRSEFNRQLRMQNIALRDMQRIAVPTELTASIFNQLGFAVPAFQPVPVNGTMPLAKERFTAKHLSLLLLLLLLLTSFISYYLMNENSILKDKLLGKSKIGNNLPFMNSEAIQNSNSAINSVPLTNKENESLSKNNINHEIESSTKSLHSFSNNTKDNSKANSNLNSKIGLNKNDTNKHNALTINSNNNDDNKLLAMNNEFANRNSTMIELSQLANDLNENNSDYLQLRNSNSNSTFEYTNLPNTMSQYNMFNLSNRKHYNWSIQFRRIFSNNETINSQLATESNFLTNNAIGIWYSPNTEISYGVEMGAEMFSQEFSNNNLNYLQTPMLNWYGVSIRYNPSDLLVEDILNPFISQTVAYTSIGPLSKTQVGLNYSPINLLSFHIGAEYGLLFYSPSSGDIFTSNRVSFVGGISINIK